MCNKMFSCCNCVLLGMQNIYTLYGGPDMFVTCGKYKVVAVIRTEFQHTVMSTLRIFMFFCM